MAIAPGAAQGVATRIELEEERPLEQSRRSWRSTAKWLGILPITAYLAFFLLIPTGELIVDAFKGTNGGFTLSNLDAAVHAPYLSSFEASLELSALSALFGAVLGFLVGTAIVHRAAPRGVRSTFVTFSGMAANFAGVPLAFAFTSTLGTTGILTVFAKHLGIDLNPLNPSNGGTLGLSLVYTYFEAPLMVLLIVPALDGLKKEWREAAENLGAGWFSYWWHVGLPILLPSLLGAFVLLFGGAFSAYATAYALSGSTGNLVTEQIGNLINGNITVDPQLAYALAFGMIVIITVTMIIYSMLQRRANRWLR